MLRHLALPLLSVAVVAWVGPMLVMRTQMNNVVDTNYVRLARAKGLSERTVMIKHAARNALIPVATSAIVGIAFILDGSVIIENLFNWPGLGQLIITGIVQRDFPTVQALFFVLSVLIIAFRLVTDVVYTYLDPRIDFEEGA
jgi:peptide/nickel transport system permease protein